MPVLEGLEPEAAAPEVFPACRGGLSQRQLLFDLRTPAARQVQGEAHNEQGAEGDRQGVAVQRLPEPPLADGPRGGTRLNTIFFLGFVQWPGFSGPLLAKGDSQQNIHAHLEELALPVLERGADEVPALEVLPQVQRCTVCVRELLIVRQKAGPHLPAQEAEKEQEQHDG